MANYEDALALFNKALAIDKTELSLYYAGLCYVKMNRKSSAQQKYDELKELNSKYASQLNDKIKEM